MVLVRDPRIQGAFWQHRSVQTLLLSAGERCCTRCSRMSCSVSYRVVCMGCILRIGPAVMVHFEAFQIH